jgi:hypothetical protein
MCQSLKFRAISTLIFDANTRPSNASFVMVLEIGLFAQIMRKLRLDDFRLRGVKSLVAIDGSNQVKTKLSFKKQSLEDEEQFHNIVLPRKYGY